MSAGSMFGLTPLLSWTVLYSVTLVAAEAGPEASVGSGGIEEIVVTARRREESLQSAPVAVTAFTAATLEQRSIGDIQEIAAFTPNVAFTPGSIAGGGSGHVFIRGIGQYDFLITTDPGVGIYVDGVYLGRTQGALFDLLDFERIEVLRGPQGTLFGKNTIGGAVNIVTARPGDEFKAVAGLTTGRFDRVDGRLSVDLPIAEETLSARLAILARNRDGYGKAVDFASGETLTELGDDDTWAARGSLRWTPHEDLEVLLSADGTRAREESAVQSFVEFAAPDPADPASLVNLYNFVAVPMFGVPPFDGRYLAHDPLTSFETGPSRNDLDTWGVAVSVDWDLGVTRLKSITSYRNLKNRTAVGDSTPAVIIQQSDELKQEQFSQEIQLSGASIGGHFDWVAGATYFSEHAENHTAAAQMPALNPVFAMFGIPVELGRDDQHEQHADSVAVYGEGSYELTKQLSISAGARYTYEQKRYEPDFRTFSGAVIVPRQRVEESWDSFSPRVGLQYQVNSEVMAYASVARGFRSGGFNGRAMNASGLAAFDPEFVWTYEMGLKSRWFDERLQVNAAGFYNDYTDIQLLLINAGPAGFDVTTENAASAEVSGLEVELLARPTRRMELSASVGYMDSEIKRPPPGSGVADGARLMETPEWSVSLGAQYSVPIAGRGDLTVRGDYLYRSEVFHDVKNTPALTQGGLGLVNLRLGFETRDRKWQFAVFGTNLTDERYKTTGVDVLAFMNFAVAQWGRPREWGASVQRRFAL